MADHARAVEAALAGPDPWEGFRGYIEAATELQVHDRGIADLITMDVSMAPEIQALRDQAFDGLVEVIDRAKTAGALRADSTPEDIVVILQANAGLVTRAHPAAGQASRRLVHVLLDGLRADAATDGPTAPSAPAHAHRDARPQPTSRPPRLAASTIAGADTGVRNLSDSVQVTVRGGGRPGRHSSQPPRGADRRHRHDGPTVPKPARTTEIWTTVVDGQTYICGTPNASQPGVEHQPERLAGQPGSNA